MNDAHLVTVIALAMAVLSFAIYAIEVIAALRAKPVADAHQAVQKAAGLMDAAPAPTLNDLSRLIEALGKLTDSLSKAGPSLTSLIAAVLFLAIAATSTGILTGGKPEASNAGSSVNVSQAVPHKPEKH